MFSRSLDDGSSCWTRTTSKTRVAGLRHEVLLQHLVQLSIAKNASSDCCNMTTAVLAEQELPGRGIGTVAQTQIKAGQTVLVDSPLTLVVAHEARLTCCSNCLRLLTPAGGGATCPACAQAAFCSPACRSAAQSEAGTHSPSVCRALGHMQWEGLDEEAQNSLRFLTQVYALCDANHNPSNSEARTRFAALVSLMNAPPSQPPPLAADLHTRLCAATATATPPAAAALSLQEAAALLLLDQQKAFGIMAPSGAGGERRVRGSGIYPHAARINHECLPSLARFDYFDAAAAPGNTVLHMRALHDIPAGAEVTQSYFPLHLGYRQRQRRCQQEYGFTCTCPRCRVESTWADSEDEEAEAVLGVEASTSMAAGGNEIDPSYISMFFLKYVCPIDGCGGLLAPIPGTNLAECNMCGCKRSEAEFQAALTAQMEDDEEGSEDMDDEAG